LVEGGERGSAAGRSPRFAAPQQICTDNAARAGERQSRQPLIDLVEQARHAASASPDPKKDDRFSRKAALSSAAGLARQM